MSRTTNDLIQRAVDRYRVLFDTYDEVQVSFSGGKDSTSIVETGAIVARERGTRLTVNFFDEEVIPHTTVEYAERLRRRPDIDFRWYCIPVKELNGWSNHDKSIRPYWYPWAPEDKDVWYREMPAWAITELPGYEPNTQRLSLEHLSHFYAKAILPKTLVTCLGRRADESPSRRTLAASAGWHNPVTGRRFSAMASPVIDWGNYEVWQAISEMGWDWNRTYMRMYQGGIRIPQLRIGPLFGEESSVHLHTLARWEPDIWGHMGKRVPGSYELARYSQTSLIGRGQVRDTSTITESMIRRLIDELPEDKRIQTERSIRKNIRNAYSNSQPIYAETILKTALRGDTKAQRLANQTGIRVYIDARKRGRYYPRGNAQRKVLDAMRGAIKAQGGTYAGDTSD